jgi:hypothetical protein
MTRREPYRVFLPSEVLLIAPPAPLHPRAWLGRVPLPRKDDRQSAPRIAWAPTH